MFLKLIPLVEYLPVHYWCGRLPAIKTNLSGITQQMTASYQLLELDFIYTGTLTTMVDLSTAAQWVVARQPLSSGCRT
jgi:hypothetical protein